MASIKQLTERKYKITISNGYRNGKKICKSQTIQVPKSVASRSIRQYVMHEAEELERRFKYGFSEDGSTTFQDYAENWLSRQSKYAPSTLASYRRQLDVVYPYIGAIPLCKLRPLAIENMLTQLRKRKNRNGQPIREATVQHYLSAVSAVLSDAKRNAYILCLQPAFQPAYGSGCCRIVVDTVIHKQYFYAQRAIFLIFHTFFHLHCLLLIVI